MVQHHWDSFQKEPGLGYFESSGRREETVCESTRTPRTDLSKWFSCFVLLLVFICPIPYTIYGADLQLNDTDVMRFADYLYRSEEYYRAISEYKRHQHFFPKSPLFERASLQIGRAYMAGGGHQEAAEYWRLRLGKPVQEKATFNRIRILLGLSLLDLDKDLPFTLRKEYISDAFQQFAEVDGVDHESRLINDFADDWNRRPPPDYRSPWLAGFMSAALPGSGSFYTERYLEGSYAFFLTALFGLAAYDAVDKEQDELALVFGFFTLTFYGGGIYTAVNSVHKTNDKMDSDELYRLRKKHGIWFIPETNYRKGRF